jgi:peptide chain release factor 1
MIDRLEQALARYRELEQQLADPAIIADRPRYTQAAKEHGSLARLVKPYLEYQQVVEAIVQAESVLATETDPDMRGYAEEELTGLRARQQALETRLEEQLLVEPGEDFDSVIMEIRAGTGGDEAALFAGDLYSMYTHYARDQGWKVEDMDFSPGEHGGFKEVIFSISGEGVYQHLRFESGGHRVQRVPETEQQGRIHTSAATVAVLPEPSEVQIEIKREDVRRDVFRSGGPGGQHQNKTESGVRFTHLPTGVSAESRTERSPHKNEANAMALLKAKLYQIEEQKRRAEVEKAYDEKGEVSWGNQIRNYVLQPYTLVKDVRTDTETSQVGPVLDGDIDLFIQAYLRMKTEREHKKSG